MNHQRFLLLFFGQPQPTYKGNGDFEAWITNTIWFGGIAPKTGSTGDLETWITNTVWVSDYGAVII